MTVLCKSVKQLIPYQMKPFESAIAWSGQVSWEELVCRSDSGTAGVCPVAGFRVAGANVGGAGREREMRKKGRKGE